MIGRTALALAFVSSLGLAACGKLGDLDQPAPLFGAKAKSDYEAHKEEAARARARAAAQPPPQTDSSTQPLTQAPYAPTLPGRNDTMPPQGPPGALPQPGQPGAPE